MKKAVILMILMALAFNGLFANAKRETASQFFEVYLETLELNKHRFADLNLIQIGDTVLLPSLFVGDPKIYRWIADEPAVNNGKHDCIWRISQRYFFQSISKPMIVEPVNPEPESIIELTQERKKNFPYLLLFGIIAALIFFGFIIRETAKKRAINPNSQEPVMFFGLNSDNQTAIRQVARDLNIDPEKITKMERCMLIRHHGPQRAEVMMRFRDGQKLSYVVPGELAARVTIEENGNTRTQLWRNHCGNMISPVKEGQIELPEGWEAVVQSTYDNPEARTVQQPKKEEATTQQAPAPVVQASPAPATFDAEGVATIIRNLPKGVAKVEIIPDGAITIQMSPKKK